MTKRLAVPVVLLLVATLLLTTSTIHSIITATAFLLWLAAFTL